MKRPINRRFRRLALSGFLAAAASVTAVPSPDTTSAGEWNRVNRLVPAADAVAPPPLCMLPDQNSDAGDDSAPRFKPDRWIGFCTPFSDSPLAHSRRVTAGEPGPERNAVAPAAAPRGGITILVHELAESAASAAAGPIEADPETFTGFGTHDSGPIVSRTSAAFHRTLAEAAEALGPGGCPSPEITAADIRCPVLAAAAERGEALTNSDETNTKNEVANRDTPEVVVEQRTLPSATLSSWGENSLEQLAAVQRWWNAARQAQAAAEAESTSTELAVDIRTQLDELTLEEPIDVVRDTRAQPPKADALAAAETDHADRVGAAATIVTLREAASAIDHGVPGDHVATKEAATAAPEEYLPYDVAADDRPIWNLMSHIDRPFCVRSRWLPDGFVSLWPSGATGGRSHENVTADPDAPQNASAKQGADRRDATAAVASRDARIDASPQCLLDEWTWQLSRWAATHRHAARYAEPAEWGREVAKLTSRRKSATDRLATAIVRIWPRTQQPAQVGPAGARLLARAGAVEAGERIDTPVAAQIAETDGESVSEAVSDPHAEQLAKAAEVVRTWVAKARAMSRRVMSVARPPSAERTLR